MSRHFAFCVLTILSVFVCSFAVHAEEIRTWTDSSGKFTIEASLVSFEGDTVKLQNKDGKVLTLAIDKLSEEDKIYLSESDFSANPFEAAERVASQDSSAPSVTVKTVDINSAKEVGDYGETSWSCASDPAPLGNIASKRFTFRPGKVPFHSHAVDNGFFFSSDGKKVLYALQVPKPEIGNEMVDDSTKIFLGDVTSGETFMMSNPFCLTPYGLSSDGSKAMFVREPWEFGSNSGQKGEIHIFQCTANKLEPCTILSQIDNPGRSRIQKKADVEQASWVSNDEILVLYSAAGDRLLVLLNVETGKAIWRLKPDFGADRSLTFSPGREYFLVKSGKAMLLIETVSGKTIGTLDGVDESANAKYAFSPDGCKIASCAAGLIRLWDATTGQSEDAFYIDGISVFSDFSWVSNHHLLAGNILIDSSMQVPIWEYQGSIKGGYPFAGQFWYMTGKDDANTLVGVTIPQKKVLDRFAGNQNDANLFAIRPGMTVALKIDASISRDADEIRRSMEDKLQSNGLTLADNAPVTFLLKVTQEGEKTFDYAPRDIFQRNRNALEVKVRLDKYELLLQQDGKTLWSRSHMTGAPRVSATEVAAKESLQEIVQRKVEEQHYKVWFLGLNIPKQIPRTDNLGKSTLTEQGLREN